jgi:hypothetical protein
MRRLFVLHLNRDEVDPLDGFRFINAADDKKRANVGRIVCSLERSSNTTQDRSRRALNIAL